MLVLVRHGEAAGNAAGVLLGSEDSPLTEFGRIQAAQLAPLVSGATRLISSPLRRAVETAEVLGLELPVEIDDRWVEIDYGAYEGRPLKDITPSEWDKWHSDPTRQWSGGESLADVGERVGRCCEDLFAHEDSGARARGDVVVVSHVSPIKAAVAWALAVGDGVAWRMYLATASCTRIGWGVRGPVLRSFNETIS